MPAAPKLEMTVGLSGSRLDARRGVARLHPLVLDMLGMRPWDPVQLDGTRTTGALAAATSYETERSIVILDDLTCVNAGVDPGGPVGVTRADVKAATTVTLRGDVGGPPNPNALRFALLGKVVTAGDHVSLLPQDFSRPSSDESWSAAARSLTESFGDRWQEAVVEVSACQPAGLTRVTLETVVAWEGGSATAGGTPLAEAAGAELSLDDLPGLETQAASLKEWFDLGFHHPELLKKLGTTPQLGVLVTGPPGSGKRSMVGAVAKAVKATLVPLWGPALARSETNAAATALRQAFSRADAAAPAVVLVEDVDAIAAREQPGPLLSVLLELVTSSILAGRIAVVCTTAHPESTAADLRRPGVLDHELEIPLPDKEGRRRILEVHTRQLPLAPDVKLDDIAARTPGFVAADLLALCREAALRAAQRSSSSQTSETSKASKASKATPKVTAADFDGALDVTKPSSLDGTSVEIADVHMDDVGDMESTKKEVTEAVIWPLRYPETFDRLGISPPRGVLLFGPPGCGKTFLVKALAHEAEANFISVKGAELLSKWVGESERGVRELFRRARGAAPALIFFDEIDALAPERGSVAGDSGVTDRVVSQLLTELDGVEDLKGVFVLGATNRPDLVDSGLLRPGRLERLIYVPPPDAKARAAIIKAAAKRLPLAKDVDLAALGAACDGYSAADLAALVREAAMTAMRENLDTASVTAAHFAAAKERVRPSLRPETLAPLEMFAKEHAVPA